jgi:hypothetical protein
MTRGRSSFMRLRAPISRRLHVGAGIAFPLLLLLV